MAYQPTSVNKLISKLTNDSIKLMKTNLNIIYNKKCKERSITPSYINITIRNKSYAAQMAFNKAHKIWLWYELKFLVS